MDRSHQLEYEEDHASHRKAHLSDSKLSDDFPLASATQDVFAISFGGRRVNTESLQSSEANRENSGHENRYYTDRNDIENSKSPS